MMTRILKGRIPQVLAAAAAALVGQQSLGSEGGVARCTAELIWVTGPRLEVEIARSQIEADLAAVIDVVNRQIAIDLEKDLDAIGFPRIKLANSEAPTHG